MRLTKRLKQLVSIRRSSDNASLPGQVNVTHFSESYFTIGGHGVHTAVVELVAAQRKAGHPVQANTFYRHGWLHLHTLGPLSALRSLFHRGVRCATAHITPASLVGSIRGAAILEPIIKRYMSCFYNSMAVVIAPTEVTLCELRDGGVRVPIKVIPNGIDRATFTASSIPRSIMRRQLGLSDSCFMVLCVGQLQPRKGIETFLGCARALPDIRFVWVGDFLFGPASDQRRSIRRMVANAPSNVKFTGQLAALRT